MMRDALSAGARKVVCRLGTAEAGCVGKEGERKNSRNTLRYFEDFFVKPDEVAAHGLFAAVGIGFKIALIEKEKRRWI